jgi:hypothetical protein
VAAVAAATEFFVVVNGDDERRQRRDSRSIAAQSEQFRQQRLTSSCRSLTLSDLDRDGRRSGFASINIVNSYMVKAIRVRVTLYGPNVRYDATRQYCVILRKRAYPCVVMELTTESDSKLLTAAVLLNECNGRIAA